MNSCLVVSTEASEQEDKWCLLVLWCDPLLAWEPLLLSFWGPEESVWGALESGEEVPPPSEDWHKSGGVEGWQAESDRTRAECLKIEWLWGFICYLVLTRGCAPRHGSSLSHHLRTFKGLEHDPQFFRAMNSLYASQSSCPILPWPRSIPQFPPWVSPRYKQNGLIWSSIPIKNQGTVRLQEATKIKKILWDI